MNTIKDILDELRIPYKTHGESGMVSHGWLGTACPWCDEGRGNPGLGFPLNGFCSSCWKCGAHSLTKSLMRLSGKDFPTIKALLNGLAAPAEITPRECGGRLEVPKGIVPLNAFHKNYLRSRRFDPKVLWQLWGVQGIDGVAPRFRWSIYVPITRYGKQVSWLVRHPARGYTVADPSQEESPHKRLLYGMDMVRNACVVVEGVTKVWAGGPGFVCTFGTGWTQHQLAELSKVPVRAILYDGDEAAQKRARELARALEPFPGSTYVAVLETGYQVDQADPAEVAEVRRKFLEV